MHIWSKFKTSLWSSPGSRPCNNFYRAMHYNAKHGIAIACRPSICLSVCLWRLVDQEHIGWKAWKLIARTISPTLVLFVAQKPSLLPGEHGEIWGRLEVGWGKVACWSTKAAISLKPVKIEEKLLWKAFRNSQTRSRTVQSPTPYGLLFPKIGGSQPHQKTSIAIIAGTDEAIRTSNLAGTFTGSIRTKAH